MNAQPSRSERMRQWRVRLRMRLARLERLRELNASSVILDKEQELVVQARGQIAVLLNERSRR